MKKLNAKKFAAAFVALSLLAAPPSLASEKPATFMKMIERATPADADNRGVLAPLMGEWHYTATVWTGAGEAPQPANGQIINEMTLDNRYLASKVTGRLNIEGEFAVLNGNGWIGYDNAKKSFTSIWIDSLSPGMMAGSGTYDEKAKTITETGSFTNPFNGLEEKFRAEIRFVDAGNYERTVYTTGKSGKEAKLMEFKYNKPGLGKPE